MQPSSDFAPPLSVISTAVLPDTLGYEEDVLAVGQFGTGGSTSPIAPQVLDCGLSGQGDDGITLSPTVLPQSGAPV